MGVGRFRIVMATVVLAWLALSAPLIVGQRTLFYRDLFGTHLPVKAFAAEELEAWRVPALNPTLGLGQPYRGNPSSQAFYPGSLLYRVLPFWSAFNLHFVLHWGLAFAGFYLLARRLRLSQEASLLAALTYAAGGWFLSTSTFYNLIVVAAWWPLALWGASRGGRRGVAAGGVACGLALLGGEPVSALLGMLPLWVVASEAGGWRRGAARGAAIGGLGLLVALPQVVATARILGSSLRGTAAGAGDALRFAFHPLRLLELVTPFPFGWPGWVGRFRFWATDLAPEMPFFLTIYCGLVALLLALYGARRRPRAALVAGAGFLLATGLALPAELWQRLSLGLFRYPEKLLFWPALAIPVLAGAGLDRLASSVGAARRWPWLLAAAAAAASTAVIPLTLRGLARNLDARPSETASELAAVFEHQASSQLVALGIVTLAIALGGWLWRRQARLGLVVLQALLLLQLFPVLMTDATVAYEARPDWRGLVPDEAAVVRQDLAVPRWAPPPVLSAPDGSRAVVKRASADLLDPVPGSLQGLSYPLAPNVEGLNGRLHTTLLVALAEMEWPQRLAWLRRVGVDALVSTESLSLAGLEHRASSERLGVDYRLYRVVDPAPVAWWPERIALLDDPLELLRSGQLEPEPTAVSYVAVPAPAHVAGGEVRVLATEPDAVRLAVSGDGGLVVVRRAFTPLWRAATADGRALDVRPVDVLLTGIVVPAGEHEVRLGVSDRPEAIAALMALAALVASSIAGFKG